ncbi:MAG: hypothetical protein ACON5F_12970 [Jejuia sp.]
MFFSCIEAKKEAHVKNTLELVSSEKKPALIPGIDSVKLGINFKKTGDYSFLKNNLLSKRTIFKSLYNSHPKKALDSASHFIYDQLVNHIVPHWYGTTWDFNGYTNIPNEGDIACGYFVSTTLKHLGFNLNRYKMAQQAGLIEAQVLEPKNELQQFSNLSFEDLKQKLNKVYDDGIYFVGLDNHVGYLLIKDKELYFLHSSYYDDKVMIELAKTSPCFGSNYYVFARINTNKDLIRKWILNEGLAIPNSE